MKKDTLLDTITQMANEANYVWSMATKTAHTALPWNELTLEAQQIRKDIFRMLSKKRLSEKESHANWMETALADHPSNKPYEELSFEWKAKDTIFISFLELYKRLLDSTED